MDKSPVISWQLIGRVLAKTTNCVSRLNVKAMRERCLVSSEIDCLADIVTENYDPCKIG